LSLGDAMKICITATEPTLDSSLDPRFGRCQFFLIADTETMTFEAIKNDFLEASGGAGIQAGQLMISKQVQAVLTGNIGPNAEQVLSAANIKIFTGISGAVKEVIDQYRQGQYKPALAPSVGSKFGMEK